MSLNEAIKTVEKQCKDRTPDAVIHIIAEHQMIADEARARIDKEGTVVRTLKGDVIAHPAIKVHADATKTIAGLMKQWGALKKRL